MSDFTIYGVRLYAARGATRVEENTAPAILSATRELVKALLQKNRVQSDALVSMLLTMTPDLNAAFPAKAARQLGVTCALLCAQEIAVPGSMTGVIRVMMTFYSTEPPCHVYMNGTPALLLEMDDDDGRVES